MNRDNEICRNKQHKTHWLDNFHGELQVIRHELSGDEFGEDS